MNKIKTITIRGEGRRQVFNVELLKHPGRNLSKVDKTSLVEEINQLVVKNWGEFGGNFIEDHVLSSRDVALAREGNKLIGLASISEKKIAGRLVDYFELTVVDKKYESKKLSFALNFLLMKEAIINNFLHGKFHLEFLLITPNMKVLGSLANLASFIYPNPYNFDQKTKKVPDADEETWNMAKALIAQSDHPDRKLNRNGLVLNDSYSDTPWLVYKKGKQPLYRDEVVNEFGQQYLEYDKQTGKEVVVRVKFNLRDIIRGVFR